ncbi:nicotinate-nucleotide--dimethylbenzimidazole phosphoribosyltransferase [Streptomyces sp. TS71-3]|uniref:nicotinate-nucleotide--dimethylbenzimidazole phosphoribosyltransferase n=1 Tax=Streptomyces sp. TS71-3 TaxID=2733862 RepID=UPI001B0724CA|nr:nicotinate-nucleotide--dimethylbenzimidazole phosphoribosyltransferase [Streptomyces sp. TS71-3]GHJ38833.1 hypothetical protein Sm713_44420 [Streptomyces sp. TS71-3]
MTETGQIPAEGLPENADNGVASGPAPGPEAQQGGHVPDAHPYVAPSAPAEPAAPSADHHPDDDMLLMPGAQGAWGQTQTPAGGTPTAPQAPSRRPLRLGPPVSETSTGVVRTLADRGPAGAPPPRRARVRAPEPEYLDTPVDDPALAGPQLGALPPHIGGPWSPGPQQEAPHQQYAPGQPADGAAPADSSGHAGQGAGYAERIPGDQQAFQDPQALQDPHAYQESQAHHEAPAFPAPAPGAEQAHSTANGVAYPSEPAQSEPVDGSGQYATAAHPGALPDAAGGYPAAGAEAQPVGQFVPVAGTVPTTPHLAPTPPHALTFPQPPDATAEAPGPGTGTEAHAQDGMSGAEAGGIGPQDAPVEQPAFAGDATGAGPAQEAATGTAPYTVDGATQALDAGQSGAGVPHEAAVPVEPGGGAPAGGVMATEDITGAPQAEAADQGALPETEAPGALPGTGEPGGVPGSGPSDVLSGGESVQTPLSGPEAAAGNGLPGTEAAEPEPSADAPAEAVLPAAGTPGTAETAEQAGTTAEDALAEPAAPYEPVPAEDAAAAELAPEQPSAASEPHPEAAPAQDHQDQGDPHAEEAAEAAVAEAAAEARPTVPAPRDGEHPQPVPLPDAVPAGGAPAEPLPAEPEAAATAEPASEMAQPAQEEALAADALAEAAVPEVAEPGAAAEASAPEASEETALEAPDGSPDPTALHEPGDLAPDSSEADAPKEPAAHAPAARGPAAPAYDEAEREAVLRVMRERRDIRNGFRNDPIPPEVLLRVLEAAHAAPSVGHSQPWDFVVIRSADTRRAMHELAMRQREAYAKSLPKGRAKAFRELKIEAILDTPVNIVVTADPTRGGRHTLGRHTQPEMAPYSSALAVENLWLAARAEGLGVGWVSFFDEREMVRALGLPEHLNVVAYLCIGYVDEFPTEPELAQAGWSKRRPLSWVVHEETYGRRALPGSDPHDLLAETIAGIRPLDAKALGEAWERQKRMTKPPGALGMLEIISAQLSGLSRMCPPPVPEPAAVAVFAGDHGVHAQGVTPWPQEVTGQMVANFLSGGAVVNAFATQVGAEVCVVDVGVATDLPAVPGLLPRKVRPGTGDMTTGPALTREEVKAAIEVGIETARDLVAAGNRALLTGEMGIANTTVSAALIAVFTGAEPAEVTGRGTGINDETLALKTEVVRRALDLHRPDPADPIGVLAAVGGLEHAAIVGLLLGGASLRTPVVLDGVSAGAAALVARAIAPEVLAACIAGHRSAEPGHVVALNKLGLRPLVDLDLRLGEGTGALLALPMIQSAARAMHEVATFDSAGVTEK